MASRPLTGDPGREWGPALSPDGLTVAYSAAPLDDPDDSDLFIQLLAGGAPLRLSPTTQAEFSPAWSPDGTQIAFLRSLDGQRQEIRVVSALGGVDRLIGETRTPRARDIDKPAPHLDWSPDGEALAIVDQIDDAGPFFISAINIASGEKRRLTNPPNNIQGDFCPRISPDGRRLAFARYRNDGVSDVMAAELGPGGDIVGEPRVVRAGSRPLNSSPAWTPDGREILFVAGSTRQTDLFAAPLRTLEPRPVARVDNRIAMLAVRKRRTDGEWVLVYVARERAEDIARLRLKVRDGWPSVSNGVAAEPMFSSSYEETEPALSPDGSRVVFISNRSGSDQLWLGDPVSGAVERITAFDDAGLTHPRWSPDGDRIAVVVESRGTADIYLVDLASQSANPLIARASVDDRPEWSADGSAMYFRSDRDGRGRIWRMRLETGAIEPVTETAMDVVVEAQGGRLFGALCSLWEIHPGLAPTDLGGEGIDRLEAHAGGVFARGADGLVGFYRFDLELMRPVASLPRGAGPGFSVSRDLGELYLSMPMQSRVDLMTAENLQQSLR